MSAGDLSALQNRSKQTVCLDLWAREARLRSAVDTRLPTRGRRGCALVLGLEQRTKSNVLAGMGRKFSHLAGARGDAQLCRTPRRFVDCRLSSSAEALTVFTRGADWSSPRRQDVVGYVKIVLRSPRQNGWSNTYSRAIRRVKNSSNARSVEQPGSGSPDDVERDAPVARTAERYHRQRDGTG